MKSAIVALPKRGFSASSGTNERESPFIDAGGCSGTKACASIENPV
jgi:hypothetical protein